MKRVLALLLLLAACTPQAAVSHSPSRSAVVADTATPPAAATLAPSPSATLQAAEMPAAWPTFDVIRNGATQGGLRVTETRLGAAADYSLKEGDPKNDVFYGRVPPAIMAWPNGLIDPFNQETPESFNAVLQRFGYRLDGADSPYTLYKGDQVLHKGVIYVGNYALNSSKTDFFALLTLDNYQVWLLQKERFELYFEGKPRVPPIFLGDRLLVVDLNSTDDGTFAVVKDGEQVIYTSPRTTPGPETCPVDFFRAWEDHWVMQIDGQDIIDGQPVGANQGYQQAFNWHLIRGKPVYLFQKDNQYGISYDGQALAPRYDQIAQVNCVVGALTYPFAAWGWDGYIRFFGQRDENWYLVEIES